VRVLALTHGPSVGPGVFADAVEAGGHELVEQQLPIGGVPEEDADAIIVLGGAMHPDEEERHGWLVPELQYLADHLERGTPMLGVCLGSQLIARAAGARVFRSSEPEVGWIPVHLTEGAAADPVAGSLPHRFEAFQWHHYTYGVPAGAVELARSPVCTQAFRLGDAAWGIQFHAEVDGQMLDRWFVEGASELPKPIDEMRTETDRLLRGWNDHGRALSTAFLDEAQRLASREPEAARS